MDSEQKHERSERQRTDESLEDERSKTDDELARQGAVREDSADAVVNRARERAEEVLAKAREEADEKLQQAGAGAAARSATDEERRREDRALTLERAIADEELADEREARQSAMAALLALERQQTDLNLTLERERIDDAIQSRDHFLAAASHDIRHLLGGMALSASLLLEIEGDPDVKKSIAGHAKRLQRFTLSMSRLVSDLLDVVSMEAGRLALQIQPNDASGLVDETVDSFHLLAAAKGVTIRADAKSNVSLAQFDRERMLQVLSNLVGNAIKFTAAGGAVDITVEAIDSQLRFAVRDTGPGIASEQLELVFERFWQGAKRHASLGLGLYIARGIVEAHGGRIWANSVVGEGSTFYFTLPLTLPDGSPPPA